MAKEDKKTDAPKPTPKPKPDVEITKGQNRVYDSFQKSRTPTAEKPDKKEKDGNKG